MSKFMTKVDIISQPPSLQNTLSKSAINDIRPGSSDYKLSSNGNLIQINLIKVEASTSESILGGEKGKFILKIDISGTDFDILKGAELALQNGKIIAIIIESSEKDQGFTESY